MSASREDRDVLTALDAFAELPEWLAAVMTPGRLLGALRRAVPELSGPGIELTGAAVDRLRAQGREWHVHCVASLVRDGQRLDLVLAGRLLPPGSAPPPDPPGAPFGEPGWSCHLAELGLHVWVETADAALPVLPSLVNPDGAAAILQRSLRDAGYRVDVAGCVPEVVRYKPGNRCTIVYRMRYRGVPGPDPLIAKTHRGDKGQTAWEAMRALWASPVTRTGAVTLAEPVAYLPEDRVLVQGPVPGERTLKDLARAALTEAAAEGSARALPELRAALSRTAVALAALHGSGARYGRSVSWEDKLAEVREVVTRLSVTVPHIARAADPLLDRLSALHASAPADPAVTAHHDFAPVQVLLHDDGIGVVDFDGSCRAEPALDLGRFRGKLRDIGISAFCTSGRPLADGPPLDRHLELLDELCEDFLSDYRRQAPVTAERVLLWETTDLFAAVLHTWTKVRTARVGPRLALLHHAIRSGAAVPAA